MIELILFLCLAADPGECREEVIPGDDDATALGCIFGAQAAAAEYVTNHPKWRVVRYACRPFKVST